VSVYKTGESSPYAKLPLTAKDEAYLNDLVEDIDCFLEENFYAIRDEDEGDDE
ncbi:MAG: hypothetical protein JWR85_3834, partial [Marmoricola sp.]|nr:hypothetical protein [Marmoricola sp.]